MMLRIGTKEIGITSYARKRDTQKGFFLELVIPKENIGMDELYTLLDGNTESIVITEEDGTENVYVGFKEIGSFACEKGAYKVAQICTSEIEAQLSLAQNKIAEQDAVIAEKSERIEMLSQMSEAQLSAIDSILTEVVPTIIDLSVTQAIEAVLATQGKTTDEEPDVVEE